MANLGGVDMIERLWSLTRERVKPHIRQPLAQAWVVTAEKHGIDMLGTDLGVDAGQESDEKRGTHFPWKDE